MLTQSEVRTVERIIDQDTPRSRLPLRLAVAAVAGVGLECCPWRAAHIGGAVIFVVIALFLVSAGRRMPAAPEVVARQIVSDTSLSILRDALSEDARTALLDGVDAGPLRISHLSGLLERDRAAQEHAQAALTLARQRRALGIETH